MPHSESPTMASPIVVDKSGAAPAPSQEDVQAFLTSIVTAKTSHASVDAAYALTEVLQNSVGFRGLQAYGVLDSLKKSATNKKDPVQREGAMNGIGALFERFPRSQKLTEAIFLVQDETLFPLTVDSLSDKAAPVRESAKYALDSLFDNLSAEAKVFGLLPAVMKYLGKKSGKWQGAVGALELIGRMADKAKIGMESLEVELEKDVLREAMGKKLEGLIPIVESFMHDLKSEVAKQAVKTMNSLTTLLQNDDIAPRIPLLVKAIEDPSTQSLQKAIHALSQTTFVAIVTSPVLAMVTPLLERSLNNPNTTQEVTRQTVVVVENLTKLVHDPIEARAFLPKLRPGVKAVLDRASMPEVREIGGRALAVIDAATADQDGNVEHGALARVSPSEVSLVLEKHVKEAGGLLDFPGDAELWTSAKAYISAMIAEDVHERQIKRIPSLVAPYLKPLMGPDAAEKVSEAVSQFYIDEDHRKFGQPVVEDDGETEIVNATFSLGYGGMLLLSHTNLRLLKGHRYGLCGRNGAGKSTLMRSIANGKLEGFPPQDEVRTCFVEHNQGEDAEITILEYIVNDPRFKDETQERISEVLEEVGFTAGPEGRQSHKVGSLSGGWKMKLALARAMLMRADVLLLDEPTNHLDVANVAWLQEYLKSHTEITSLIVSHDSGFLDAVCTDIYHYEQKKLVNYKGNLADFVRQNPEGKSYYTLSASLVQFKFPPPGILTGVKSNTRSILRMTDCTFTYPGAAKPSLFNASCNLSLSSRVAIIGANGAGKSTLIKILTGEVTPQDGKVEKHPNLRIGYIKQHALEHVEMHLEKTPNQYLQWRYANGDDREVLMKQTRVLTEEDKAQMDTLIDLGDGSGGRKIEALIGRQKYKKTFQYEVKWMHMLPKYNTMISRETLLERGFQKLIQEFDDHEASREGLGYRVLEPKVISKHFEDLGMDPEIANHNEISGLSGGQKVKVVLAGAMWNNPHLLVLDEPTNFLDRDSLGGLAVAIRDYKGGVIMISHNEEFVGALCPEQWHVIDGRVQHKGHLAVDMGRFEDSRPGSSVASSNVSSAAPSSAGTPIGSDVEGSKDDMKFRSKKKKKMTKKEVKEREVRRRLRYIDWLNSPKGTPQPPNTDDEAE
ncbi:P-loop containing nucleoside triphosphate hydrolase protein [Boeremia exigua]|uniref:P-loop containing nucleoside triphosphate hydrolase protein n=1 Tax=Boeremia exigua TaxID=749465 RepID=UPI001E8E7F05|nr:P-loop containing nucleoside triphosphate hydrolase protein [Boeremia exigua]KAH6618744.1 P-loop containing nucleoside triphosphate hydrolase protein [Boeremia exigua]